MHGFGVLGVVLGYGKVGVQGTESYFRFQSENVASYGKNPIPLMVEIMYNVG